MTVERATARGALVLGVALSKSDILVTGNRDDDHLTSFHLTGIGSLVVLFAATANIILTSFLIDVQFITSYLQLLLECIQVHGIGIEEVLINLLCTVPVTSDVDTIGIRLLCLLATTRDDIGAHPLTDAVTRAVG